MVVARRASLLAWCSRRDPLAIWTNPAPKIMGGRLAGAGGWAHDELARGMTGEGP